MASAESRGKPSGERLSKESKTTSGERLSKEGPGAGQTIHLQSFSKETTHPTPAKKRSRSDHDSSNKNLKCIAICLGVFCLVLAIIVITLSVMLMKSNKNGSPTDKPLSHPQNPPSKGKWAFDSNSGDYDDQNPTDQSANVPISSRSNSKPTTAANAIPSSHPSASVASSSAPGSGSGQPAQASSSGTGSGQSGPSSGSGSGPGQPVPSSASGSGSGQSAPSSSSGTGSVQPVPSFSGSGTGQSSLPSVPSSQGSGSGTNGLGILSPHSEDVDISPLPPKKASSMCLTDACVKVSDYLRSSMNRSADPCNDFYNFVCGNFANTYLVRKNASLNLPSIFAPKRKQIALDMFLDDENSTSIAVQRGRKFYKNCIAAPKNLDPLITTQMVSDLLNITDIPLISGSNGSQPSFWKIIDLSRRYSCLHFISVVPQRDGITLTTALTITPDLSPMLQMDNYEKTFLMAATEIQNASGLANLPDEAKLKEYAKRMIEFEKKVIDLKKQIPYAMNIELSTVENFSNILPLFELDKLAANHNISKTTVLAVNHLDFLKKIHTLIEEQTAKDKTVIPHFIAIRLYIALLKLVPAHESLCLEELNSFTPKLFDYYFVKKFSADPSFKADVEVVINGVSEQMRKVFEENKWLDESTRKSALEKLDAAIHCIGYPDQLLNLTHVDNLYKDLHFLDTDNYLQSNIKLAEVLWRNGLENVGKPYKRKDMCSQFSYHHLNAFYSPEDNLIAMLSGYLQWPLYDSGFTNPAIKFGMISRTVGHEITHGFDSQGKQFGPKGEVLNWWTQNDLDEFNNRSKCLIDKFNQMVDPITKLNTSGITTLGENIADLGGGKLGFRAFQEAMNAPGAEKRLPPGLDFLTNEQLFFVSLSSYYCNQGNLQLHKIMMSDAHALNEFRVENIATNTPEFGQAFNCKKGVDRHYPSDEDRCEVW